MSKSNDKTWNNRIIAYKEIAANQLLANPDNARRHPPKQREALRGSLDTLGIVDAVLVNSRTGFLIDGHARVEEALTKDENMLLPVLEVDISEKEEKLFLASFDRITALAEYDRDSLNELLHQVQIDDSRLSAMLAEMAEEHDLYFGDNSEALLDEQPPVIKLTDRFIVPPFSVLDARQGYWQSRKRAWLSLGIQSELGRGVTPGGSLLPAATLNENGKTQRGDGKGRTLGAIPPNQQTRLSADYKKRIQGTEIATSNSSQSQLNALQKTGDSSAIVYGTAGNISEQSGTSIFDPVLCELAYRWFSPVGAHILDPFAGGSVRGIVASKLDRHYTGVDLSEAQIAANIEQGAEICSKTVAQTDFVDVKISAKMACLQFNGCDPEYIRNVCHASCCQSSLSPIGTMITIHPSEIKTIEAQGGVIKDGLLQPRIGEKRCPFKTDEHLCSLHFTPDKPFGCIASPFTLNDNNTLIVRNRYKLLKCYNDGNKIPAYKAFRASLDLLFGDDEAERICSHFDNGGGDVIAQIPYANYVMCKENDDIKHKRHSVDNTIPQWIVGDSVNIDSLAAGEYDLIFTCPPYADLEIYSDDERDISNMKYPQFLDIYRQIIVKSCAMLNDNRFACIVVGDVRNKQGNYNNFVSDTIQAFLDAGLELYNEAILVTAVGSLPIRAGKQFVAGRKLGKTHQNILVFLKGNSKKATEYCGDIEVHFPDELLESS